jgi:long-chain acyl-CoA synthetase
VTTSQAPSAESVRTIAELPFVAAEVHRNRPAQRFRADGGWQSRSFRELAETVRALARGLIEAGVAPGDRVCIISDTRPEWTQAGLAALAAGAIVVPIYPSSSEQECEWVLGNSGARMVICENAAQLGKIGRVRDRLPELAQTVLIDPAAGEPVGDGGSGKLAGLIASGASAAQEDELERRLAAIDPGDPCLIIYTSGTTGPPKGCVLTHTNWLTVCSITEELSYLTGEDVVYLFLPLAHVFAQIVQFACLYSGAELVYYGGDPRRVVPELAETRPTFVPSVPRVFEKVYSLFAAAGDPAWLARAVAAGLEVRRLRQAGEEIPAATAAAFDEAEALFGKVRAAFGGRLRQALSGAAPISPTVLEFFHAAGVPVLEGYGMTETTGLGTVNTLAHHRLGKVGVASPGTAVRLADDGEVLMSGPHVFAGYWRDPEATAAMVVDGWLHTGDLGALDADGFLTITGRKKDIIITAGGKNIAPANLENELRQSRWISHAVMFGDARPYPVALLTLDADEIVPWGRANRLPEDLAALTRHPLVLELIQAVVDEVNARHSHAVQVKRFTILARDLTQEAGELTPTLKVKRRVVQANNADLVEALYA